jgi:hypothetical protein
VQRRDSLNSELPVETLVVGTPADDGREFEHVYTLDADERISVVAYATLFGAMTTQINWQRLL